MTHLYDLEPLPERNLIFIISQPRSGSTLLQYILAGHPAIISSSEPWIMLHPIYALKETGIKAEFDSSEALIGIKDFLQNYANGKKTYLEAIRAFADVLYGSALDNANYRYFLDKTPRYYLIIPELYEIFPQAKFIFLIRNPLGVLYSILTTWVELNGWRYLSTFKFDLLVAPKSILDGIRLLQDKCITIHYEDLVRKPNNTISDICRYLNISFNGNMVNYNRVNKPIGRHGDQTSINQYKKPNSVNLEKWKNIAFNKQTNYFAYEYLDALGKELISDMGYDYSYLRNKLNKRPKKYPSIIPWDIAIKSREEWNPKDYIQYLLAGLIQKEITIKKLIDYIKRKYINS